MTGDDDAIQNTCYLLRDLEKLLLKKSELFFFPEANGTHNQCVKVKIRVARWVYTRRAECSECPG